MPKTAYLQRLKEHGVSQAHIDDVEMCLPTADRESNIRNTMEVFQFDPDLGRDGILLVADISEAYALLNRPNFNVCNFHYDREAKMLLVNLERGVHEHLCGALYRAYTNNTSLKMEDAAEQYIEEGLGWALSSASYGKILIGKAVSMTPQERAVFGKYPTIIMD